MIPITCNFSKEDGGGCCRCRAPATGGGAGVVTRRDRWQTAHTLSFGVRNLNMLSCYDIIPSRSVVCVTEITSRLCCDAQSYPLPPRPRGNIHLRVYHNKRLVGKAQNMRVSLLWYLEILIFAQFWLHWRDFNNDPFQKMTTKIKTRLLFSPWYMFLGNSQI